MNTQDLAALEAGFSNPALGSQTLFRAALHALAHPGECVHVSHCAGAPTRGHRASAALLLALLDPDCGLWLSPELVDSNAAQWLRFHTGCVIVDDPRKAQFAWVAAGDVLPALEVFPQGSDTYPDQSATCVIDVAIVNNNASDAAWSLVGPGIHMQRTLRVETPPCGFVDDWERNQSRFPRGVDVFFATDAQIVGLPRTTQITRTAETKR